MISEKSRNLLSLNSLSWETEAEPMRRFIRIRQDGGCGHVCKQSRTRLGLDCKEGSRGLESCGQEHILLFQRMQVQFPAPTVGSLQL